MSDLGGAAWAPELMKARAYEQILVDVIMGALAPGAAVDERALARRYGVGLGAACATRWDASRWRDWWSAGRAWARWSRRWTCARSSTPSRCAACWRDDPPPWPRATPRRRTPRAVAAAFHGAEAAVAARDLRALVAMDRAFHRARGAWPPTTTCWPAI